MKRLMIAAAIVTASVPALAQGGPASDHVGPRFDELDLNADGTVSHDELMVEIRSRFDALDVDGNGFLELQELPKEMPMTAHGERRMERMKKRMERHAEKRDKPPRMSAEELDERMRPTRLKFMARFDKNGDEKVDINEFGSPMFKRHKHADLNGDGSVTKAELEEAREHHKKRRMHKGHRRDRG